MALSLLDKLASKILEHRPAGAFLNLGPFPSRARQQAVSTAMSQER